MLPKSPHLLIVYEILPHNKVHTFIIKNDDPRYMLLNLAHGCYVNLVVENYSEEVVDAVSDVELPDANKELSPGLELEVNGHFKIIQCGSYKR